jgi:hypothetical protein
MDSYLDDFFQQQRDKERLRQIAVSKQQTSVQPKKTGNFFVRNLPTIAGVGAGLAAAPFTGGLSLIPALAIAGGAAAVGAGSGELARQKIQKESLDLKKAGKEALYSGAGEIAGLGLGNIAGKILAKNAGRIVAKGAGKAIEKAPNVIQSKAAQAVLKSTRSTFENAANSGLDINNLMLKWSSKLGNYDDALGAISTKGRGGKIAAAIAEAEDAIQATSRIAGKNIRISGDDIIKSLRSEAKNLATNLGEESKRKALMKIISEAEKKYGKGITVNNAIKTLRQANERFGASILETTGDAVARSAQKVEANVLRTKLKTMFPEIANALETQSELLTLRPILQSSRASTKTGAWKIGQFDLAKPGSWATPVLNNENVARGMIKTGENVSEVMPSIKAVTAGFARQGTPRLMMEQPVEQPTEIPTETPELPQNISSVDMNQTPEPTNGITKEMIQKMMMYDLQTTGGKNIPELETIAGFIPEEAKTSKLSDAAIKATNDYTSALNILGSLKENITASSGKVGPVGGLSALDPWDTESKSLQAKINTARQIVGKAMEGGVLRKEDEEKYKKILPTIYDTPEVAQAKIDYLIQNISAQMQNYTGLQNTRGGGTFQLPSSTDQVTF